MDTAQPLHRPPLAAPLAAVRAARLSARLRPAWDWLRRRPRIPRGKGIFVRSLTRDCGTPEEWVARCRACGLRWVAVEWIWQDPDDAHDHIHNRADLLRYARALRRAGIRVHVWGYPCPGREQAFASALVEALALRTRLGRRLIDGWIIDPEAPYLGRPAAARVLMDRLVPLARRHGIALGVSSYGAPWYHGSFPWSQYARCDYGLPQAYDARGELGPDYPARSCAAWRARGYERLVPILAAYHHTPREMGAYRAALDAVEDLAGVSWWDARNAGLRPERWDAIAQAPTVGT